MEEYYTAKEAAGALGIEYSTLLARIRKKKIKAEKFGWAVLVPKSEVDRVKNKGAPV